ncbi:ShlB/FhaC/HecB family hemolysin secretion/activation protein [Longitalea arenae]|uniref:ShlB/FhaC/HecB family hemolysin secretion/activation protein n=1 Tax=Longitalea arenae TaxID=2812558 RepID=UPI0019676249|nr:ShlB/FhaC/HecB family hemolysin secretion/activation protein [Longitalea arenae]
MRCYVRSYIYLGLILLMTLNAKAQSKRADTAAFKQVVAGPAYKRPAMYQKLWGRNHRVEWTTPVRVPVLNLDTAFGGLIPYEAAGGHESRSLKLRSKNGKEYALRSINKSRDEVIPDNLKGTFAVDIVNDAISMSHPYGAFAIPYMLERAGIYHTWPKPVYLPQQKALDSFNKKFANDLYLLEEKPEGDWREADNLGNFRSFNDTEEMLTKLQVNSTYSVDQRAFAKARLFDMLIGDWDRHEGNWSWGEATVDGATQFKPVPKDRDQAFYYHDGFIASKLIKAAGLFYMQRYDSVVKDISKIGHAARFMDRYLTNQLTLEDWLREASALQEALSDTVIAQSVAQMPAEIYAVKGKELIATIKARRNQLPAFAKQHYLFIAKEVEVTGTRQREYFEVSSEHNETVVSVYHMAKNGERAARPYYQRRFKPAETKEIRLFGIKGEDVYVVNNEVDDITVRIIGGPAKDSIIQAKEKVHIYDNANNVFQTSSARMHLSEDTAIHNWNYKWFKYDKRGMLPLVFYNNPDRLYAGLRYRLTNYKWRREPFASAHEFGVHYSISQNAFSAFGEGMYPHLIGRWDVSWRAEYDMIRWTNFYGTGNETKQVTTDINYYRMRSEEWYAGAGISRSFGKNTIGATAYYQQVRSINDSERFFSKLFSHNNEVFETHPYAGLHVTYSYVQLKDSVVPVSGFTFLVNAIYSKNFRQNEFFHRYNAHAQVYVPLLDKFSMAIRFGGETIVNDNVLGTGQAYEHAIIGGPRTIRGFRRERFWGKTAVYNSNELRFITDFRSYLMTGKIGVFAFFDQGRVWMPGEQSNTWHMAYGPGIMISPFKKYYISVSYGIAKENKLIQLRLNRILSDGRNF